MSFSFTDTAAIVELRDRAPLVPRRRVGASFAERSKA
jgi:hypothetical protein